MSTIATELAAVDAVQLARQVDSIVSDLNHLAHWQKRTSEWREQCELIRSHNAARKKASKKSEWRPYPMPLPLPFDRDLSLPEKYVALSALRDTLISGSRLLKSPSDEGSVLGALCEILLGEARQAGADELHKLSLFLLVVQRDLATVAERDDSTTAKRRSPGGRKGGRKRDVDVPKRLLNAIKNAKAKLLMERYGDSRKVADALGCGGTEVTERSHLWSVRRNNAKKVGKNSQAAKDVKKIEELAQDELSSQQSQ